MRSRATQDHPLAAWGQGATYQRLKQEARFVQKSDMGATAEGFTEDTREFVSLPAFHLLVVALPRPPLRFVAAVVQPPLEQLADVFGVILDAEVTLDKLGNPSGSPQLIGEAVGGSSLAKELFQIVQLSIAKSAFGTRRGLGSETVSLASHPSPAVQGGASDAEDARHHGRGFPALK
jgi:hypothetical protein